MRPLDDVLEAPQGLSADGGTRLSTVTRQMAVPLLRIRLRCMSAMFTWWLPRVVPMKRSHPAGRNWR